MKHMLCCQSAVRENEAPHDESQFVKLGPS